MNKAGAVEARPRRRVQRLVLALAFQISSSSLPAFAQDPIPIFPAPVIPEGFGVNIHFTDPQPGEMELLASSGLRWVRMDLLWAETEREKGRYDFSAYDRLMFHLKRNGLKALFILDYGNPLYDRGLAPFSDEGRMAFARWAVAAAQHFSGNGILWEIWNEPNRDDFWRPKVDVDRYLALATQVGEDFRRNALNETLIGPASAKFPYRFLDKCLKGGLWKYWSGVSIHPYRGSRPPETASFIYRRLKNTIRRYAPASTHLEVLSGEWGYSNAQRGIDEAEQAKYLIRMWLNNLSEGIPVSIWYDWRDDGNDPKNREHHFGLVHSDLRPKPAFTAAKTLNTLLQGFRLEKRLPISAARAYGLLFRNGDKFAWTLWTSSPKRQRVTLEAPLGNYRLWDYLGREQAKPLSKNDKVVLELNEAPQYLISE